MTLRTQHKINRIMDAAYDQAFKAIEAEVKKFMKADPRFVEYVHAVGWGPSFFRADRSQVEYASDMPTKRGREVMELCIWFYDTFGAGNERIKP